MTAHFWVVRPKRNRICSIVGRVTAVYFTAYRV